MNLKDITIGDYVKKTAMLYSNQLAIITMEREKGLTWQELDQLSDEYAKGFLSLGLKKDDHLALWSSNKVEWVLCFLGASKVGIRTVMLNINYTFKEIQSILTQSDAKALVFMDGFRDIDYIDIVERLKNEQLAASAELPMLEHFIHFGKKECLVATELEHIVRQGKVITTNELNQAKAQVDCHDIINIQYTSGTTSAQKGVMLSHYNLVNSSYFCGRQLNMNHQDRLCIAVPFFHCFGVSSGLLTCIGSGTTMVLVETYRAKWVMEAVSKFKCTVLHGVPTMFRRILDHPELDQYDFSSLRTGIIAAAACSEKTLREIHNKLNMTGAQIGYGQTEASPGCTQTSVGDSLEIKIKSVGQALPFVEMKVVDTKTGEECPVGRPGELCTRGYHVMKGYYKDEALTKEVIDDEGWLHTGDVGYVDEAGYYYLCGRMRDIIIRGGENISPCEIEQCLRSHPDIADAQVYGIPDEHFGEEIAVSIKIKSKNNLAKEEIKEFLKDKIAYYKIPKHIEFCKGYPMTATGKVQKYILKENMIEKIKGSQGGCERKTDNATNIRRDIKKIL